MGAEQPAGKTQPMFSSCSIVIFVAAIVIVASILWPRHPDREKARQVSCISNEKQLALGLLAYAKDYDDRLPIGADWAAATMPFGRLDSSVYRCPDDENPKRVAGLAGLSYAMPERLGFEKLKDCAHPKDAVLVFDSDVVPLGFPGSAAFRHAEGANFAFTDGHAKWLRPERVDQLMGGK
jgi:prepilin-type processing-associated H-X9-DG protein